MRSDETKTVTIAIISCRAVVFQWLCFLILGDDFKMIYFTVDIHFGHEDVI